MLFFFFLAFLIRNIGWHSSYYCCKTKHRKRGVKATHFIVLKDCIGQKLIRTGCTGHCLSASQCLGLTWEYWNSRATESSWVFFSSFSCSREEMAQRIGTARSVNWSTCLQPFMWLDILTICWLGSKIKCDESEHSKWVRKKLHGFYKLIWVTWGHLCWALLVEATTNITHTHTHWTTCHVSRVIQCAIS